MEISYFEMSYDDIPIVAKMEQKYFNQPWKEESISHYLESGTTIFIVAKDPLKANEDHLAGYLALMQVLDEAELVSIAVHEDYREIGIAREMLDIAYEMAAERGVETIHLEVRMSNEPAIALYESEGFEKIGVRKGFYDKPKEDALLYRKTIKGN